MLTFNALLESAGISPKETRMARHQRKRGELGVTPADLWRKEDGSFKRYQDYQSEDKFGDAKYIANFVPGPVGETLFVGLYRVLSKSICKDPSLTCPISGHSVLEHQFYETERVEAMDPFIGKVVVEWGPAHIAWVQRADRQPKDILEIRKSITEPDFPGYIEFISTIRKLPDEPSSWRSNLSTARGIYLLVSLKNGKNYVGSATGSDGFWGRWMDYLQNGHGGNDGLQLTADADYQVTILEVAASSATVSEIIELEHHWMRKLMTTTYGLNTQPMPGKAKVKAKV
ncbi:GIY-YIG nuclease family protein [Rhodanobacter sp. DHB23]|uniref:GIY-YIG nuclease family protein n=1 Tax=Rhodanobacter sp. DHB23 TaxID=2775923 RepID=UPI001783DD5B|nr:GIY-YIG nuclease family protein [Rhodanobacter sp. DHB23]MBD8872478.1 GIY-YIG nuclease family protein [Rhodanobacter sp. DHB23]